LRVPRAADEVAGIDGAIVDWNGFSSLYDYPLSNLGTLKIFSAFTAISVSRSVTRQSIAQQINNGRITPTRRGAGSV
jgi:hypothetical protein